jgi:hypothetical protein
MKRPPSKINVVWEYCSPPDAEARIEAAFDLLYGKVMPPDQNLTENGEVSIMSHDETDSAAI